MIDNKDECLQETKCRGDKQIFANLRPSTLNKTYTVLSAVLRWSDKISIGVGIFSITLITFYLIYHFRMEMLVLR